MDERGGAQRYAEETGYLKGFRYPLYDRDKNRGSESCQNTWRIIAACEIIEGQAR